MRTWLTPLILIVASVAPASADPKADAKARVETGQRYFNVQQYDKAIEEFQAAYVLDPLPDYLYALAQAQRVSGDCTKALRSYETFLRLAPSAKFEALAKANIERCKRDLEQNPPVAPPVEPPKVVPVPPLATPAVTSTPSVEASPWYKDRTGHALVGSGLAVAITGVALYVGAENTIDDVSSAPTYLEFVARRNDLGSAHTKQRFGVTAMAIGGGLIVGGVVHYILRSKPSTEQPVSVALSPGSAVLAFTRSF